MKSILVTGSTGLLGTPLTNYLREERYQVFTHSLRSASDYRCDLGEKSAAYRLLDSVNPDIVINLVALTDVDECEKNPRKAYWANVKSVENLVSWADKNDGVTLIHISTDHVYDGEGPHTEDDVMITNVYSFSKYCAELLALQVNSVVLRINFFGHSTLTHRNSISDWLIESLLQQKTITVFADIFFSPLSFQSLQQQIVHVLEAPVPGIFNLGSRNGMSKRDFAHTLAGHLDFSLDHLVDGSSRDHKFFAYRPKDMRMDVTLYEKTYKVTLPTLLEEIKTLMRF